MIFRIKEIHTKLKERNLDGLILSSNQNISYLTNSRSRDSYLLICGKKNIYLTDSRYIEEAKRNLKGCIIKKIDGAISSLIADTCKDLRLKRVGFEENYMSFAEYNKIMNEIGTRISLIPTKGIVEGLRTIKNTVELSKIKKAIQITLQAFDFIKDFISPGKNELEIAGELERFIRLEGAYSSAFEIIVASGPNSSFPHHITSKRRIRNNEPVLIDIGVDYLGYKSDLTRMLFLGKIKASVKRIYAIIKEAQAKAIEEVKPGLTENKIDAVARQYISQKGFGGFFGHSLGHGVGLEVHEAPQISSKGKEILQPGMVFTIEPAIYLPGKFGIRIEDMVLVTKKGARLISGTFNK